MENNLNSDIILVSTLEDENDGDVSAGDLSLREAIALANEQEGVDTISFVSGLNGDITLTEGELSIEDALKINGLGAANLTVDGNNSSRVFKIDDGNSEIEIDVTIDGLTIADGLVADEVAENLGGGIFNQENLTISSSVVSDNSAESNEGINNAEGGGIYTTGTLNLIDSEVNDNSGGIFGGGISSLSATVNITNSSVDENYSGFVGGGLFFTETEFNITNSTVTDNEASFGLAGLDINDSIGDISDSIISDNVAESGSIGGISINDSLVNISNSTISENSASQDVGGISVGEESTANISNSTIANNSASGNGGGINIGLSARANISNSTISGNIADNSGAGIFQTPSVVTGTPDGDLTLEGGVVNLVSTIVAGNINSDLGGEQINSNGNNLIGNVDSVEVSNSFPGDLIGTVENPLDPLLEELEDNGGATPTIALLDGSLAINAGSNPNGLETDQRGAGFNRTIGSGTDIGAFEVQTNDTLLGETGRDTLNGGFGNDSLDGGTSDDLLLGDSGDDILNGGNGRDTLDGGAGHDLITGGNGNDTFVLSAGAGTDIITDFGRGNNVIGLADGITFADLSLSGGDIILGTETLSTLDGFDATTLAETHFVSISI